MDIQQRILSASGWETIRNEQYKAETCQLVIGFAGSRLLADPDVYNSIRQNYPNAAILLSSSSGEIADVSVSDETLSLTAITFKWGRVQTALVHIDEVKGDSYQAGKYLAGSVSTEGLKSILVISDGLKVNGSELVLGLQEALPENTIITGGLAGDGVAFKNTVVGLNEVPVPGRIAAIAFYGESIRITHGSMGGWDSFGPERLITRSSSNILYELDGKPALDIYKMYLGSYADELPGSGLLFPLSIRDTDDGEKATLVRTILSIDEQEKSLTFAGNMPEGSYARLMKANLDRLIEGASNAAQKSMENNTDAPDLAILISCVGRRLVLNQRVEEEVEIIRSLYGDHTAITGFYSYGEISPADFRKCELHNQTMTITTITETC